MPIRIAATSGNSPPPKNAPSNVCRLNLLKARRWVWCSSRWVTALIPRHHFAHQQLGSTKTQGFFSFTFNTALQRAKVIDPGLNQETLNPGCSSASTPRSIRTQSRLSRFALVSRPCVGGRPVDAPPWKRHLPPAPRPGFLHCTPDCRDVAEQRGRAASTARALSMLFIALIHEVSHSEIISGPHKVCNDLNSVHSHASNC